MKSEELLESPYGLKLINRDIARLSELCVEKDGIQTGPFGSQLHNSDYVEIGTPIITVEHLGENVIDANNPPRVHADDVARLAKYKLQKGDIVFSRVGSVDRRALVSPKQDGWMFSGRLLRIRTDVKKVDAAYLSYFFGLPSFKSYIRAIAVGATMPSLNTELLKNIPVLLPPIGEQRVIGETLSYIDRLIESNRRISKSLEEIAQTIFKSWFVDFDPVKAKMVGEKPVGMDDVTAALFPDAMEDSELGPIPKGWVWGSVGDIAQVIDCLHSKKPELLLEGRPYLQLDTIHDDGVLRFENAVQISDADYEKWTSRIEVGDGDCVITNVGRVGAVSQVPSHFTGAIGRNITAIRPADKALYKTFLAVSLTSSYMKKEIRSNTDSGTILEALNVRSIPKLRLPIVNTPLFEAFEKLCGPIQNQRQNLHRENVKLAEIRDSLLPRLISGQLQISEELLAS